MEHLLSFFEDVFIYVKSVRACQVCTLSGPKRKTHDEADCPKSPNPSFLRLVKRQAKGKKNRKAIQNLKSMENKSGAQGAQEERKQAQEHRRTRNRLKDETDRPTKSEAAAPCLKYKLN